MPYSDPTVDKNSVLGQDFKKVHKRLKNPDQLPPPEELDILFDITIVINIFVSVSRPRESSHGSSNATKDSGDISSRLQDKANGDTADTDKDKSLTVENLATLSSEVTISGDSGVESAATDATANAAAADTTADAATADTTADAAAPPVLLNGDGHSDEAVTTEETATAVPATTNGSEMEEEENKEEEKNMINPAYDGSMEEAEEEEDKTLERKMCEEMHNSEFKADMDLIEAIEEENSMKEAETVDSNLPQIST